MKIRVQYEIHLHDHYKEFDTFLEETEAERKGKHTIRDNHSRASLAKHNKQRNSIMLAKSRR